LKFNSRCQLRCFPGVTISLSMGYDGISADFVKKIAARLGINLEMLPGLTWAEMLDELKNRTVDVITPTRNTREREEFMSFMQPCIATPLSIVTRKDHYWF
jgi:ABC-type amino acid transport substrate-binding protein